MHTVKEDGGKYIVWLDKKESDFKNMLDCIRSLPARKWDQKIVRWIVPLTMRERLMEIGFQVPELQKKDDALEEKCRTISGKYNFLKHYQSYGVAWLLEKSKALLADDMGLGKTVQMIVMLNESRKLPALVVCPASLKINWIKEISKWSNLSCCMINGSTWTAGSEDVVVVNYDIVGKHSSVIKKRKFKTIICDESHYIKNEKTKRSIAVTDIAASSENFFAVSGTPIENRPKEFYTTLRLIDGKQFSSFWRYAMRYCGARNNGFGWDFGGSSNTGELNAILAGNYMLRRKKEDVLKELPPKQRFLVPIEIKNDSEYYDVLNSDFDVEIERLQKLKRTAAISKFEKAIEWLSEQIDSGNKIVVFAMHHDLIDRIASRFSSICVKFDGRDSQKCREESVVKFQTDESCRLFVGNVKAAGVGITLTAASNVVFFEFDWVPGVNIQAEDRIHRIGQNESATCWYLVADGTIEEDIFSLLNSKKAVLDSILDGDDVSDKKLFWELAKKYCVKK